MPSAAPATRSGSCVDLLCAHHAAGRHICVGLDPEPARLPQLPAASGGLTRWIVSFHEHIVDHTADLVCAYKPNVAFFEALGAEGHRALAGTIAAIRRRAPGVPVILDAKRGDIASSNRQYAIAAFDELGADAITVQPYLGGEALQPFLERPDKLVYVLARTSNPGCGELQDLVVDGVPLYRRVARTVAQTWNANGNCGLVLGATSPRELEEIRGDISPALPVLVPGVGAQGGDLREVIATHRRAGSRALVISVSRSVLWASSGPAFGDAARAEVQRLNAELAAGLGG